MKIGIISDTHGNTEVIDFILDKVPDAKLWLHAGDLAPDAAYLEETYNVGVVKVAGNCDWPSANAPNETIVEVAGHKIFLTHGHIYGNRFGAGMMIGAAREAGCDMVVCGHTHVAQIKEEPETNIWLINPGSASRPRDERRPSFMTAILEPNQPPKVELHRIEH